MKRIVDAIEENPFMKDPRYSVTSDLFNSIFDHIYRNTENELSHLKDYSYVLALLDYGPWRDKPDLFQFVNRRTLKLMKKKKCFFIFDASNEGFSPRGFFSIFDYLYNSCKKHRIDPGMIIYLTGNLKDEKNIAEYANKNKVKPFNVLSITTFEYAIARNPVAIDSENHRNFTPEELYESAKEQSNTNFKKYLFSSLSRINRPHRMIATFLLCQKSIAQHALISHDVINDNEIMVIKDIEKSFRFPEGTATKWVRSLPRTVDYKDFEVNWATEVEFRHIHDETIFQIVNETLVDNEDNTSLFYSEKTFKPMLLCQPFVIYGQQGCNHALKKLGYKLYDDWFDLSFDFEEDNVIRYQKLLESLEKTCKKLESMSRDEKIEWRFKNKEVLIHNCRTMMNSRYSTNKIYQFFKNLNPSR